MSYAWSLWSVHKNYLFSAPVLFSDCILLSLGDILRHSLLLRKASGIHSRVNKTLNYNNYCTITITSVYKAL